jgi:hypothetical protein
MASLTAAKSRTASAQYAMMVIAKIQMLLSSVTAATLRCTKNAMVCRLFQKASGFVGNASYVVVEYQ